MVESSDGPPPVGKRPSVSTEVERCSDEAASGIARAVDAKIDDSIEYPAGIFLTVVATATPLIVWVIGRKQW